MRRSPHQPSFSGFEEASDCPPAPADDAEQVSPAEAAPADLPPDAAGDLSAPAAEGDSRGQVDERPAAGRRVVVVDAHSLIYQVFHALPPMTSPAGEPVAAVHGFIADVLELLQRQRPDYLFCAFDKSEVTFRQTLYEQYKAHRESMPEELRQQMPLIRELLQAMGIVTLECGGFEADDILATIAAEVDAQEGECLLVTSDKDCRQLITDRVRLYNIRRDEAMGPAELWASWGVRPDQVVDYQALVGDPVDNVPGIPLIGPKLAQQLLEQFDTLEGVLEHAGTVSGPKRRQNLLEGRERAMLSRELVRLRTDVPCPLPWQRARVGVSAQPLADPGALDALFDRLGFRRLKGRAAAVLGWDGEGDRAAHASGGGVAADSEPAMLLENLTDWSSPAWGARYRTVTTPEDLRELLALLQGAATIAIDTETTGTNPRRSELVGVSLAWAPGQAAYVPVRAPAGEPQLDLALVLESLRPILEDASIAKVGQNLKFEVVVLRTAGVTLRGLATDTMVADYLLDPGQRNHSLDDLARRHLSHGTIPIKQLIGTGKKQKTMDQVPLELVGPYAAEDADVPVRLAPLLRQRLDETGLVELFDTLEMPLIDVLAEMEFNGIRVDRARLSELSQGFTEQIERLRGEIHALAGHPFTIDSPKQLAAVLFDQLQLPVIRRTKTGASTDAEVLQALAPRHELPAKVVAYRQAAKLKNTYVDALPLLVNEKTGRLHSSFRQDVAATGRLSSSEPNLQNIPIRTAEGRAIRSAFRAGEEGWLLLGADYSQIELRVLAHYSGDAALLEAYAHDADIHTRVAAEVHGVEESAVTPDMRRMAKTINFGIVYGQSAFGLARTLGIGREEAAQYIETYFARYPGVQQFMLQTLVDCRRRGYVETMLGRRRTVQGVRDVMQLAPERRRTLTEAERIAVNTVIQGSAADLIKLAMLRVHQRLAEADLRARLLLQIHDELLFEVAAEDAAQLAELVREVMTGVAPLRVPLKVDVATGPTWAEV